MLLQTQKAIGGVVTNSGLHVQPRGADVAAQYPLPCLTARALKQVSVLYVCHCEEVILVYQKDAQALDEKCHNDDETVVFDYKSGEPEGSRALDYV